MLEFIINSFHANPLFLYPLKTSENLRFSDIYWGYKNRTLALNGLTVELSFALTLKLLYETTNGRSFATCLF